MSDREWSLGPDRAYDVPPSLEVLSGRMRHARAAVHDLRQQRVAHDVMTHARRGLLLALDDYVTALEKRRLPVPPALKSELDIHRALFR